MHGAKIQIIWETTKKTAEKYGSKGKKNFFDLAIGGGAADYFNPKLAAVQLRGAFSLTERCLLLNF
jgi:hypothetical protein